MANDQTNPDAFFRSRLARTLTTGALFFLVSVAVIALIGAAVYSYGAREGDEKRATFFFDMAKYILATILPVVAGWVGTVLAFYYGKENFEAGTRSVATAANVLTSKDKLASTSVSTLGMPRADFKALSLTADQSKNPEAVTLDIIEAGFK